MRKCLLAMLILMLSYPDADPDATYVLNLNTGYADTDTDLCIKIMSLCCINICHCRTVKGLSEDKGTERDVCFPGKVGNSLNSCLFFRKNI